MRTLLRPTFVCALALAAAACGGGGTNDAAPAGADAAASGAQTAEATVDPCSLVSKEDVAAVTGEAVLQTKADGQTCRYETDDDASALQVDVKATGGREEMEVMRKVSGTISDIGEDLKGEGGAKGDTGEILAERGAAPKIGDEAFFGANSQLHVLKGDAYFAVLPPIMKSRISTAGNPLLSSEQKREIATGVAQKIAAKL